jgi:methylthioribose-1-phosphate isomerase
VIRGAPAIGIAGAMGCALGAGEIREKQVLPFLRRLEPVFEAMESARPTAINLKWAINRLREVCYGREWHDVTSLQKALVAEALRIQQEDLEGNWRLGRYGSSLIGGRARILTYCNTGSLATGGYGTALGIVRACWRSRKKIEVFACETRPFLQGARLTAWELMKEGIPVTLITDNTAGYLMQEGGVDCVIVGADRVAANGDVANKIGTYGLAALARIHKIPFYVAAPLSSVDLRCRSGIQIPIEIRDPEEVTSVQGNPVAPKGCRALNPAFDITPHALVTAVVTDQGIARPPYRASLRALRCAAPGA